MPVLIDKTEWTATLNSVKRANRVWCQHVVGREGECLLSLPISGSFNVIFVEVEPKSESADMGLRQAGERKKPCISDFIGYGERFHKLRSTEEWMKELREGEEE